MREPHGESGSLMQREYNRETGHRTASPKECEMVSRVKYSQAVRSGDSQMLEDCGSHNEEPEAKRVRVWLSARCTARRPRRFRR